MTHISIPRIGDRFVVNEKTVVLINRDYCGYQAYEERPSTRLTLNKGDELIRCKNNSRLYTVFIFITNDDVFNATMDLCALNDINLTLISTKYPTSITGVRAERDPILKKKFERNAYRNKQYRKIKDKFFEYLSEAVENDLKIKASMYEMFHITASYYAANTRANWPTVDCMLNRVLFPNKSFKLKLSPDGNFVMTLTYVAGDLTDLKMGWLLEGKIDESFNISVDMLLPVMPQNITSNTKTDEII